MTCRHQDGSFHWHDFRLIPSVIVGDDGRMTTNPRLLSLDGVPNTHRVCGCAGCNMIATADAVIRSWLDGDYIQMPTSMWIAPTVQTDDCPLRFVGLRQGVAIRTMYERNGLGHKLFTVRGVEVAVGWEKPEFPGWVFVRLESGARDTTPGSCNEIVGAIRWNDAGTNVSWLCDVKESRATAVRRLAVWLADTSPNAVNEPAAHLRAESFTSPVLYAVELLRQMARDYGYTLVTPVTDAMGCKHRMSGNRANRVHEICLGKPRLLNDVRHGYTEYASLRHILAQENVSGMDAVYVICAHEFAHAVVEERGQRVRGTVHGDAFIAAYREVLRRYASPSQTQLCAGDATKPTTIHTGSERRKKLTREETAALFAAMRANGLDPRMLWATPTA